MSSSQSLEYELRRRFADSITTSPIGELMNGRADLVWRAAFELENQGKIRVCAIVSCPNCHEIWYGPCARLDESKLECRVCDWPQPYSADDWTIGYSIVLRQSWIDELNGKKSIELTSVPC